MSLRSPLGRVIGLGSAKSGSEHWYSQRVSAVAVAVLSVWFIVALAYIPQCDVRKFVLGDTHVLRNVQPDGRGIGVGRCDRRIAELQHLGEVGDGAAFDDLVCSISSGA